MAAKKHSTNGKSRNSIKGPSHKSTWAAYMNAVDLDWMNGEDATKLAAKFGGRLPMWFLESQPWRTISGEAFKSFRRRIANLSLAQTAAYLRVSQRELRAWESGVKPVPFASYEALRLCSQNAQYRLSHKHWDGWFIQRQTGQLISPDIGRLAVTPAEINGIPLLHNRLSILQAEIEQQRMQIAELQAENITLRSAATSRQVALELEAMQARIAGLLSTFHTAEIIEFNQPAAEQRRTA